jgi:hypothetical protein
MRCFNDVCAWNYGLDCCHPLIGLTPCPHRIKTSEHGANSRPTGRCSVQPIVLRRALALDGNNEVGLEGNPPFPGERSEPGNKVIGS